MDGVIHSIKRLFGCLWFSPVLFALVKQLTHCRFFSLTCTSSADFRCAFLKSNSIWWRTQHNFCLILFSALPISRDPFSCVFKWSTNHRRDGQWRHFGRCVFWTSQMVKVSASLYVITMMMMAIIIRFNDKQNMSPGSLFFDEEGYERQIWTAIGNKEN